MDDGTGESPLHVVWEYLLALRVSARESTVAKFALCSLRPANETSQVKSWLVLGTEVFIHP